MQREFLIDHKCDISQGYLFSKPLSVSEITKPLIDRRFYIFDSDISSCNKNVTSQQDNVPSTIYAV
jgi:hypothetical protein